MQKLFPRDKAANLMEKEDILQRTKRPTFGEQGTNEWQNLTFHLSRPTRVSKCECSCHL